jgi:hypothetical protein
MSDENTQTIMQTLNEIKTDVNTLKIDLISLKVEVHDLSKELGQTQKWQDRTWDVIKWVGGISAALAISAAIALVGLLIRLASVTIS